MVEVSFNLDYDQRVDTIINLIQQTLYSLNMTIGKRAISMKYRLSSSRRGYHVNIVLNVPKYIVKNVDLYSFVLGIRYLLGDDLGRIKADVGRKQLDGEVDRLFILKNGKKVTDWVNLPVGWSE